jgi:hypothetical protein
MDSQKQPQQMEKSNEGDHNKREARSGFHVSTWS